MYIKALDFVKFGYNMETLKSSKDFRKYLISELYLKRNNDMYKGKSTIELYEEALNKNEITDSEYLKHLNLEKLLESFKKHLMRRRRKITIKIIQT
jgi:hypothetical protein